MEPKNKIKNYELFELNVSVSVWVYSEDVPEDVIKFLLRSFLKNFNDEGLDFGLIQVSL